MTYFFDAKGSIQQYVMSTTLPPPHTHASHQCPITLTHSLPTSLHRSQSIHVPLSNVCLQLCDVLLTPSSSHSQRYEEAAATLLSWGYPLASVNLGVPFYDSAQSDWGSAAAACPEVTPEANNCSGSGNLLFFFGLSRGHCWTVPPHCPPTLRGCGGGGYTTISSPLEMALYLYGIYADGRNHDDSFR